MKIKLITFGKMDKNYFREAGNDYQNRLKNYAQIEILELTESTSSDSNKNTKNHENMIKNSLEKLKYGYEVFLLDNLGTNYDSENLSAIFANNKNFKSGKIALIIGPSEGFTIEFKNNFSKISLGKNTFPHQLLRIMLLEQIYRSFKIINNEKYHK
ncbi:23S rRNA (pseudouridine(1915)-N(3))-methyltransferase RlmH [Spiroplasma alleghenense]|uniref:Ribosomal RNA large subunit methyltransferase H n=1 Tax=Spiroplasma alleghenense TaxID=216931 RepID=A0A345Z374_9MOLU|nr:23S rRNA (pseudouridine(1915)-N(3))-methyltransferase RlmH [Spiroplasma alleghenense]AXK51053.1 23S rRNA (pseudouridine1915-N3)-methyltransferase [Spiroplasma alleghenense]